MNKRPITKEIFSTGNFEMLNLIARRLHNAYRKVDKTISFQTSGNSHIGNRLEVVMIENPKMLKLIKESAKEYKEILVPFFAKK